METDADVVDIVVAGCHSLLIERREEEPLFFFLSFLR